MWYPGLPLRSADKREYNQVQLAPPELWVMTNLPMKWPPSGISWQWRNTGNTQSVPDTSAVILFGQLTACLTLILVILLQVPCCPGESWVFSTWPCWELSSASCKGYREGLKEDDGHTGICYASLLHFCKLESFWKSRLCLSPAYSLDSISGHFNLHLEPCLFNAKVEKAHRTETLKAQNQVQLYHPDLCDDSTIKLRLPRVNEGDEG